MKLRFVVSTLCVLLCVCTLSRANITNVWYHDDGDGAFVCSPWTWTGNAGEVTLPTIYGDQFKAPGHLMLDVHATDASDPTLILGNSIDNETTNLGSWVEFDVNLYMDVAFTVTNVTVGSPLNDWTVVSADHFASYTGSNYVAHIVYDTGTPIALGQSLDFGYKVIFSGSPAYTITQEMIPVVIPEPSTIASVVLGGLLLGFICRRRR